MNRQRRRAERRLQEKRESSRKTNGFLGGNWYKFTLPALGLAVAGGAALAIYNPFSSGQNIPIKDLDNTIQESTPIVPPSLHPVVQTMKGYVDQCYENVHTAVEAGNRFSCGPLYLSMLEKLAESHPEIGLDPSDGNNRFLTLQSFLKSEGLAVRLGLFSFGGEDNREFTVSPINSIENSSLEDGTPIEIVMLGKPHITDFPRIIGIEPFQSAYTADNGLFISEYQLDETARLLWTSYEKTSNIDIDDLVELHKRDLRRELKTALSTGDNNSFIVNLWFDLVSKEWKDLYHSSAGKEDFIQKYRKASSQITKAHELDHLREQFIEGKEHGYSDSETRAGLQEILNLPNYDPESFIDGYSSLAGISHWLNTDLNDNAHFEAGRDIINCYIGELRKPHEKGSFYADVTNLEESGQYLIGFLDLTRDQILEIGQSCNKSLVGNNPDQTGYFNPDVTQTFSETESDLLVPTHTGFNHGYLRGNNFYPLSLPHLVADQIHKENISNLGLSPSLRQVA